jgi:hypothetical protein
MTRDETQMAASDASLQWASLRRPTPRHTSTTCGKAQIHPQTLGESLECSQDPLVEVGQIAASSCSTMNPSRWDWEVFVSLDRFKCIGTGFSSRVIRLFVSGRCQ